MYRQEEEPTRGQAIVAYVVQAVFRSFQPSHILIRMLELRIRLVFKTKEALERYVKYRRDFC